MTISVRLSEKLEKLLRDEAQNEKKNISEIVNSALEKYYFMHKYFDSNSCTPFGSCCPGRIFQACRHSRKSSENCRCRSRYDKQIHLIP